MTLHAVFDVDGVLADTHDLVRQAYAKASITMPDHAWGQPWKSWLVDMCDGDEDAARDVHALKNLCYADMIRDGALVELPAAGVVRDLVAAEKTVALVTSASRRSVLTVVRALRIPETFVLTAAIPTDLRRAVVLHWGKDSPGVYFDDLESGADVVAGRTDWTFCHVTPALTADEIKEALQWTQ